MLWLWMPMATIVSAWRPYYARSWWLDGSTMSKKLTNLPCAIIGLLIALSWEGIWCPPWVWDRQTDGLIVSGKLANQSWVGVWWFDNFGISRNLSDPLYTSMWWIDGLVMHGKLSNPPCTRNRWYDSFDMVRNLMNPQWARNLMD